MHPIIMAILIFYGIFILFIMRCYFKAEKADKKLREPGKEEREIITKNFWESIKFKDESYLDCENPTVTDRLN